MDDAKNAGEIRLASLADLKYVEGLQKKFSNQVGFLPRCALEAYLNARQVTVTEENSDPAGYLIARTSLKHRPELATITQACVQMDAQRRHHGLAVVSHFIAAAKADGAIGVQACCRLDLDSNEFWKAAGFKAVCFLTPKNARRQPLICWRLPLIKKLPLWFAAPPLRAGSTATPPRMFRDLERLDHVRRIASSIFPTRNAAKQSEETGKAAEKGLEGKA